VVVVRGAAVALHACHVSVLHLINVAPVTHHVAAVWGNSPISSHTLICPTNTLTIPRCCANWHQFSNGFVMVGYVMVHDFGVTGSLQWIGFYLCLERGPLSLVSTTEELLDRKVAAPV
jgi:hypothetical protein